MRQAPPELGVQPEPRCAAAAGALPCPGGDAQAGAAGAGAPGRDAELGASPRGGGHRSDSLPPAGQRPRQDSPSERNGGARKPARRADAERPRSARELGSFPDKGLRGAPAAFPGTRTAEAGRPGPGAAPRLRSAARSSAGDEPSATCPRPAHLPGRPRPAPLPGFSPASAEEAAEESVRTLGSLCERPRDTRQPLPSSDAAMGLAGAGASCWNQSIRGGQGHRRGGWRGRFFKKENQKGQGEGRSRGTTPGWLQGGETMASRLQPGASRRAASLCYLFVFIPILQFIFQEKKKKVEPGNKNFFLSVFIACLGQGVMSRNFWGCSLPPPHPPPPRKKKGKRKIFALAIALI